ncbi:MAG: cyclic nucleotide-binding domain-containing protein [Clostridia bacterium]|nr:cyclic nucleotide-binding domain-containing protein [Deltaproteobacteria bacterium]
MASNTVQNLLQTTLGNVLAGAELSELVHASAERSVGRGAYLFRAGDMGTALYVVVDGALDIVVGRAATGESVVATLGPGQLIGEIELLTRTPRVASVLATEETNVLEISASHLDQMHRENRPVAAKLMQAIARLLARRLAAVNQCLVQRAPKPVLTDDIVEMSDEDMIEPISQSDLDVLDRLWS